MRAQILGFWLLAVVISLLSGCSTMSPGIEAISKGDVQGLRKVLDAGTSPEYVEEKGKLYQGMSLLQYALTYGNWDSAELLMDRGADPNKGARAYLPTVDAVGYQVDLFDGKTLRVLLEHGMDPNLSMRNGGARPIHFLCENPTSIGILVKAGANVSASLNGKTEKGETYSLSPVTHCLNRAVEHNEALYTNNPASLPPSTVELMLKFTRERRQRALEGAWTLLRLGADPRAVEVIGDIETPVLIRAYVIDPGLGRELLDRGADILAERKPGGLTVLHAAAKFASAEDVRDLLERARKRFLSQTRNASEADRKLVAWINQTFSQKETSEYGYTALHRAAQESKLDTLRVLIKYGADPSIVNKEGKTAQKLIDEKAEATRVALANAKLAERRRAEKAEEDARESATNRQMALAVLGSVAIAKGMSGPNYTEAQRRNVIGAFATDRANAANGVESNNFGQAADQAKQELDLAALSRQRDRDNEQRRSSGQPSKQVAQAVRQEQSPVTSAPSPATDYDALNAAPGQEATFKCLSYPPEKETVTSDANCFPAVMAWKGIACRADWPTHRLTQAMYECGVKYSRGKGREINQRKLDGTLDMIRKYGRAED